MTTVFERKQYLDQELREAGVRNFRSDELGRLPNSNWDGPRFALPPMEMLPRIVPALKILQVIRDILGPIRISSGYRPHAYNAILPGASPNSKHKRFEAVDFYPVEEIPFDAWVAVVASVVREAQKALDQGVTGMKIGLFIYPQDGFCHIDCGPDRDAHIIRRMTT